MRVGACRLQLGERLCADFDDLSARALDFMDGLEDIRVLFQRDGNRGFQSETVVPVNRGFIFGAGRCGNGQDQQRRGEDDRPIHYGHLLQCGKIFS